MGRNIAYRKKYHKSQKLILIHAEKREKILWEKKKQPARVERCRRKCRKETTFWRDLTDIDSVKFRKWRQVLD